MADDKKSGKAAKKERETRPYAKGKFCPKCGPGIKLAEHANRRACGKCGYFERTTNRFQQ